MFTSYTNVPDLWVHGPMPEYSKDEDWADQWYIAARTIALLRPNIDCIVLPCGKLSAEIKLFWDFCSNFFGYAPDQVYWTSGVDYLIEDGVCNELLPILQERFRSQFFRIVPYAVTKPFTRLAEAFPNGYVFGDSQLFVEKYSNKATLHPSVHSTGGSIFQEVQSVIIPKGFTCSSNADMVQAFNLLREFGIGHVLLKPSHASTGEGIIKIADEESLQSYTSPIDSTVVLEEMLTDFTPVSVQYNGPDLYGEVLDQTIKDNSFSGSISPSSIPLEVQESICIAARDLLRFLSPKGPGGFDFLVTRKDNKAYFVDPNIGRFTGAHPGKIFRERHSTVEWPFKTWKLNGIHPELDVYWSRLKENGVAFSRDTGSGVFPLCYIKDVYVFMIAIAKSPEEIEILYDIASAMQHL